LSFVFTPTIRGFSYQQVGRMSKKGNYNDSRKTSSLDALFVMLDVLFMEKFAFFYLPPKKKIALL
jgi:hypothetical protein